ncbi:MAG: hypothetical protein ACLGI5_03270 [Thermoleophilia bacterium]
MADRWRERERRDLLAQRRRVAGLCVAFSALTIGGFLVASLAALVVGAIGATLAVGALHNLRVAERLLSRD